MLSRLSIIPLLVIASCTGDSISEPIPMEEVRKAEQTSFYEDGQFLYRDTGCVFIAPGETTEMDFVCREILIGLNQGVTAAHVADLIAAIDGEIIADRSHLDRPWIGVRVPLQSEQDAILTALSDSRTRYAAPNFSGPVTLPSKIP